MKSLITNAILLSFLLIYVNLAKAEVITSNTLSDLLRWVPEQQNLVKYSCELGNFFVIVNVKTKRVLASCPTIFTGMKADKIMVKSSGGKKVKLYTAILEGISFELKVGKQGKHMVRPNTVYVHEHGVLVSLFTPE